MAYTSDYPIFSVTVDVVAFTLVAGALQVLVIERGDDTGRGETALPGGFVGPDEPLLAAAVRELREETGVDDVVLEQLATYGDPGRDPRGRVVTVAHLAVLPHPVEPTAGTDAADAAWRPVSGLGPLAFDHARILADGVERLAAKIGYTALATAFLGEEFTLGELRAVYEAVWGVPLDPGNFQRAVRRSTDFVAPTGGRRDLPGRGRPAALFRALKSGTDLLDHPIARP